MLSATSSRNRSPFTPSQWQELEHQALIYKYMVSGIPIPHELINRVKRSLESSLASRLFPHQPVGWGCFQVGFGRKADPEPGRCRRTDGKKWRCSKEAFPYSKYCEKHMHRGRNRSRKPVELTSTTANSSTSTTVASYSSPPINRSLSANTTTANANTTLSAYSYTFSPLSSPTEPDFHAHQTSSLNNNILDPFLYSHSPSSGLQNSTTHNLFLDSSSTYIDKDYRYYNGMREDVDERTFFPESSSGSSRNLHGSYQEGSYKSYSQAQFETLADNTKREEDERQHCFVLGTDFKSSATRPIKFGKESETQKPLHHFLGNQWPPKNSDSWLDLASTSRSHTSDS